MNDYEQQIIKAIQDAVNDNEWEKAEDLINEELRMPYIEKEFETTLRSYHNQLAELMANARPLVTANLSESQLRKYLGGNQQQQLAAINFLAKANLRNYTELLQDYFLENQLDSLIVGSLIEELIEQELNTEFKLNREGKILTFRPSQLQALDSYEGFLATRDTFSQWFGADEPSVVELCTQALVEEVYRELPYQWTLAQSEAMALALANYVYNAYDRHDEFLVWLKRNDYSLEQLRSLAIESIGNKDIMY